MDISCTVHSKLFPLLLLVHRFMTDIYNPFYMKGRLSLHIQWEKINLLLNVVELFCLQPKVIRLVTVRQGGSQLALKVSAPASCHSGKIIVLYSAQNKVINISAE